MLIGDLNVRQLPIASFPRSGLLCIIIAPMLHCDGALHACAVLNSQMRAHAGVTAKVIYSGGADLDILPQHASKGKGLEFLLGEVRPEPSMQHLHTSNCVYCLQTQSPSALHQMSAAPVNISTAYSPSELFPTLQMTAAMVHS